MGPMTAMSKAIASFVVGALLAATAWAGGAADGRQPLAPLPPPVGLAQDKVALGRALFHDPILSADGTIACAHCHDLARAGTDGQPVSLGVGGKAGARNAPTVYNAVLNLAQFWDGRAASLHEQAAGPIANPVEMAAQWPDLLDRLGRSVHAEALKSLYGSVSKDGVLDAIATFERTLITVNSRFDRWLTGDATALTERERKGFELFRSYGCAACHQGANVGGNLYQRFGFFGDWFAERDRPVTDSDLGRLKITGRERDRFVFKVPSLRLATRTAPYFHDGSVPRIEDAIRLMARYQLGRDIPEEHVALMVVFLGTLSDSAEMPR